MMPSLPEFFHFHALSEKLKHTFHQNKSNFSEIISDFHLIWNSIEQF